MYLYLFAGLIGELGRSLPVGDFFFQTKIPCTWDTLVVPANTVFDNTNKYTFLHGDLIDMLANTKSLLPVQQKRTSSSQCFLSSRNIG